MPLRTTETSFRTLDGLRLAGTLVEPQNPPVGAIVLVLYRARIRDLVCELRFCDRFRLLGGIR